MPIADIDNQQLCELVLKEVNIKPQSIILVGSARYGVFLDNESDIDLVALVDEGEEEGIEILYETQREVEVHIATVKNFLLRLQEGRLFDVVTVMFGLPIYGEECFRQLVKESKVLNREKLLLGAYEAMMSSYLHSLLNITALTAGEFYRLCHKTVKLAATYYLMKTKNGTYDPSHVGLFYDNYPLPTILRNALHELFLIRKEGTPHPWYLEWEVPLIKPAHLATEKIFEPIRIAYQTVNYVLEELDGIHLVSPIEAVSIIPSGRHLVSLGMTDSYEHYIISHSADEKVDVLVDNRLALVKATTSRTAPHK